MFTTDSHTPDPTRKKPTNMYLQASNSLGGGGQENNKAFSWGNNCVSIELCEKLWDTPEGRAQQIRNLSRGVRGHLTSEDI